MTDLGAARAAAFLAQPFVGRLPSGVIASTAAFLRHVEAAKDIQDAAREVRWIIEDTERATSVESAPPLAFVTYLESAAERFPQP